MLLDDGITCDEIDECDLNRDNCQQECINIERGFECGCFDGYSLNDDQATCSGMCGRRITSVQGVNLRLWN